MASPEPPLDVLRKCYLIFLRFGVCCSCCCVQPAFCVISSSCFIPPKNAPLWPRIWASLVLT